MMCKAWWLMAAATVAGAAWALDPPRPAPAPATSQAAADEQPPPPEQVAVPAPAAQEPAEPQADTTVVPPPPEAQRTGPTPQRFNPTEEVRADFPVSFPSDI